MYLVGDLVMDHRQGELFDSGIGCRNEVIQILKDSVYKYNSHEERERLEELGRRLSEERLLSHTSARELVDLYDRYSDEESLDSIVTSIKHPGLSQR